MLLPLLQNNLLKGDEVLIADTGVFILTGTVTGLQVDRTLTTTAGVFTLTGIAAILTVTIGSIVSGIKNIVTDIISNIVSNIISE